MKVWVLEKFKASDDMKTTLIQLIETKSEIIEKNLTSHEFNAEQIQQLEEAVDKYDARILAGNVGEWIGIEGNRMYNDFCVIAKAAIKRDRSAKFRVMEGEISDEASTWLGYTAVRENPAVLKYLYATL